MQREKRKRGHEATPRQTRIIEREKRKRDEEASRRSMVSSSISRQTRMREKLRERMLQCESMISYLLVLCSLAYIGVLLIYYR